MNTKRNMDTVPRLPIHPFNLPRQLKNILYSQNQNGYVFLYFTRTNIHIMFVLKSIHLRFELTLLIVEIITSQKLYISVYFFNKIF